MSSQIAPRRSFETFSIWALFATIIGGIVIVVPIGPFPFLATKTFFIAIGTLITVVLYILARLGRGNIIFPPTLLLCALGLPVIAYLLSAALSPVSFSSALWGISLEPDTLGFMLTVACLGILSALMLRRVDHYQSFLKVGLTVFSAVVLFHLAVVIIGQFIPNTISPSFTLFGSYEWLAAFLGLGVIGTLLSLRFGAFSDRARQALIGSSVAALVLLAIANSALVWILLALAAFGLFVESVLKRAPKNTDSDLDDSVVVHEERSDTEEGGQSIVMPLIILAVSLFFIVGGTLSGALANALNVDVNTVRPSWQATIDVAQKTYATSPIFGTGPGSFGSAWLLHRNASLNETIFWNVNFTSGIGFIPTSLVTTGLLGLLAWVSMFLLFIVFGARMLIWRMPQDSFIYLVALYSFIATLYLFAIAIFTLPSAAILALLFVFAGLFVSTMRYAQDGKQWGVIFSRSPRIGFIVVFSLTLLLLVSVGAIHATATRYIATMAIERAAIAYAALDLDSAETYSQNAISFAPNAVAQNLQALVAGSRLDQILATTNELDATTQQAFQNALSVGIGAALNATRLAPNEYQYWITLGSLYGRAVLLNVTNAYESAKEAYERAKQLNPTSPQIPFIMAQLEIANNNLPAAEEQLNAAIALKQDYTAAIFLLSQLKVQQGKVQEALESALAAAFFTPNNPNILFQIGILYASQDDFANAAIALEAAVAANPQFANARYFLSAVHVKLGDFEKALKEMQAIANISSENAQAVAQHLELLKQNKDPFPANFLSISEMPVR